MTLTHEQRPVDLISREVEVALAELTRTLRAHYPGNDTLVLQCIVREAMGRFGIGVIVTNQLMKRMEKVRASHGLPVS